MGKPKWSWKDEVVHQVTRLEADFLVNYHIQSYHLHGSTSMLASRREPLEHLKQAVFWLEKVVAGTDLD